MARKLSIQGIDITPNLLGAGIGVGQVLALSAVASPRKAFVVNLLLGSGGLLYSSFFARDSETQDSFKTYGTTAFAMGLALAIYQGLPEG